MSNMECLQPEKKVKRIIWKRSKEKSNGEDSAGNGTSLMKMEDNVKKRPHSDSMTSDVDGPCMMSLLPLPNFEECNSRGPVILTGTACKGVTGPPVGVVDIGVSISAYYFRIALPGVKKDPGEFNCEIEKDGKVLIRGMTSTGGRTVSRYSRVFDMKIQQQCPSGAFIVSFSLPGPVDPRFFSPNFRSDGIFEAVEGIFQEYTEYLNMCIEYTYKADDVVQTGAAREGRAGVPNDPVTITVTEVAYKFKVVLPSVARSLSDLSYDIHPYGDVEIEGMVRSGEITSSVEPIVCNRRTRRIFPQGHFTINFTLPGPADSNFVRVKLNPNGVLEGSVLKRWVGHGDQSDSSD